MNLLKELETLLQRASANGHSFSPEYDSRRAAKKWADENNRWWTNCAMCGIGFGSQEVEIGSSALCVRGSSTEAKFVCPLCTRKLDVIYREVGQAVVRQLAIGDAPAKTCGSMTQQIPLWDNAKQQLTFVEHTTEMWSLI